MFHNIKPIDLLNQRKTKVDEAYECTQINTDIL